MRSAHHALPEHPRDLLAHAGIRHRFASGKIASWEFEKSGERLKIAPVGPVIATTMELEIAVSCAGLGIIYTFEEYLASALKAGDLVPVLPDWWQRFSGPYLYYASRSYMPAPLRSFVDFIKNPS